MMFYLTASQMREPRWKSSLVNNPPHKGYLFFFFLAFLDLQNDLEVQLYAN
jgi:hypothetical protein